MLPVYALAARDRIGSRARSALPGAPVVAVREPAAGGRAAPRTRHRAAHPRRPRVAGTGRTVPVGERVTLQTIADALGVSRTTVSNAYNRPDQLAPELREQVLEQARRARLRGPGPGRAPAAVRAAAARSA